MQTGIVRVLREDRDVGRTVEQTRDDLFRIAERYGEVDGRMARVERREHFHHVVRPDRADAQASGTQLAGILQKRERLLLLLEDPLRRCRTALRRGGKRDAAPAPREELDRVRLLERAHLGGHRGLAHVQRAGAGGEPAVARDGEERAQVGKTHRFLL
jgi:hypothetical protein